MEKDQKYPVKASLPAKFNIYNMLAAYTCGRALDLAPERIIKGLESVKLIKGRMEEVLNKRGIKIIVDYAVTPESFELLFRELKRVTPGRLISVFGATGDRDKEKRPRLGEVAAKLTDEVIITDEEPYSENPAVIVDAIAEGAYRVRRKGIEINLDRREAIKRAIEIATQGDTVVITGMGHEKYRNIGGNKKITWDETKIIKEILEELK